MVEAVVGVVLVVVDAVANVVVAEVVVKVALDDSVIG